MGRKKKSELDKKEVEFDVKKGLGDDTMSWLFAITFLVLFCFFILSAFKLAGPAGNFTYKVFSILFGDIGYYVLPALCMIFGLTHTSNKSIDKNGEKKINKNLGGLKVIGSILFLISSLGFIDLISNNSGGIVGGLLRRPLIALFDIPITYIILVAGALISLAIMLDAPINPLRLLGMFKKKEIAEDDIMLSSSTEKAIKEIKEENKWQEKVTSQPVQVVKKETGDSEGFSMKRRSGTLKPFTPPPLSLLERDRGKPEVGDIKANANIIKRTLQNFGIIVEMDEISIGPSVTRYALKPAEGVKLSKILGLQNNLELALAAHPVRIEAPIPGKSLVGIEIPNSVKTTVGMASILSQSGYTDSEKPLMISLGKGITGEAQFANLAKIPHLLIAGTTGSGKSVTIHAIITSLLFRNSPDNLKFIMIDPKRVELTLYNKIPHLLTPVITEVKKTIMALKWAAKEMDRRYDILEKSKVRDIESYHKNILEPLVAKSNGSDDENMPETMPYIVIIIDELADIMQAYPRELEAAIVRLAQMSRAVGIHLILSTQRPSVNVITGLIKANIPGRIALQVASQFDSRTIMDTAGAEKLLGAGDMLYSSGETSKSARLQSPYISENEVKKVVEYLINQNDNDAPSEINLEMDHQTKNPIFNSIGNEDDDGDEDDLYSEAKQTVISTGKASTSYLQRKLRVGYARAARLIDILEEKGVVGPGDGSKPREVLIKPDGGVAIPGEEEDDVDNGLL